VQESLSARRADFLDELSQLHQRQKHLLLSCGGFVRARKVAEEFISLQEQIGRVQLSLGAMSSRHANDHHGSERE
jgi:hypothetical protein